MLQEKVLPKEKILKQPLGPLLYMLQKRLTQLP